MTIVNVEDRAIAVTENDIIVLGVGKWCKRAADLAAAQYRPCVLIGAKERYPATKYEPLYLAEYDEQAIAEYCNIASFATQINYE